MVTGVGGGRLRARVSVLFVAAAMLGAAVLAAIGAEGHSGAWIDSAWTTSPPGIDGAMAAGEWADATSVDLSAIPGNALPALLLVKNDANFVYAAYDAVGDITEPSSADGASISFDTGHDTAHSAGGEDQFFWGPAAMNGEEHYVSDGANWYQEDSPFNTGLPDHAGLDAGFGFGPSDASATAHRLYELAIPLALIGVSPGDVIGLLGASQAAPGVFDVNPPDFAYSTWPDFLLGPPSLAAYGDLRLGKPSQPNDVDLNPPSQTATGTPATTVDYRLDVVNQGIATDTFDLGVMYTLGWSLWDASGMNPLPDTDGDTVPDSGTLSPGAASTITVRVGVPASGCADAFVVGTSSNDVTVAETALLHTCVPPAELTPPHSDMGVDTDAPPNGLYDELDINVGITVGIEGTYEVDVFLFDQTQSFLITAYFARAYLAVGQTSVTVPLRGLDIYTSGIDGPYVAAIFLYDNAFTLLDQGAHTTGPYLFTDFDPPAARLNPPHSDVGVDTDSPPNGLYDELVIDVGVAIDVEGFYEVDLILVDQSMTVFITYGYSFGYFTTGPQTVPVSLLGYEIRASGIDGPYVAIIALYDDMFNLLDQGTHTTASYLVTDFDAPPAEFLPPHSDVGIDTDAPPNGLYDVLEVLVGIQVNEAGSYYLFAELRDQFGFFISAVQVSLTLGTGPQAVALDFPGRDIFQTGLNGPYTVYMALVATDYTLLDLDQYTTGAYSFNEFDPPPARFSPPHSDRGLDLDVPPDGMYEFLEVTASVDVADAGRYTVSADLLDNSGMMWITAATATVDLMPGLQGIDVRFDGIDIQFSGFDGPYMVVMSLSDDLGVLDYDTYFTGPYAGSDFAPPGAWFTPPHADSLLDPDLDGLADYLRVDAAISVAIAGVYQVQGVLVSSSGPIIGIASCQLYFSVGSGTCPVDFSGHDIAASGVDGPYTAYLQLFDPWGRLIDVDIALTNSWLRSEFEPYDTAAPSSFAIPLSYFRNAPSVAVEFLATDPSPTDGLASATLYYRHSANNATWSPWTEWTTVGVLGTSAGGTIPFTYPAGPGYYEFQTIASDLRGNDELLGGAEARVLYRPVATLAFTTPVTSLPAGSTGLYTVEARDAAGNPVVLEADMIVPLTTTSPTGEFRAVGTTNPVTSVTIPAGESRAVVDYYDTRAGDWVLEGRVAGTGTAVARVSVSPGPAASVTIDPSDVTVPAGGSQQFTATAVDAFGNVADATFAWLVITAVGTISPSGLLTASTSVGSGIVTVRVVGSPGVEASATVSVVAGPAARVVVSPSEASMVVASTQTFTAEVQDAYGNPATGTVTWGSTGGIGSVSTAGVLTAGQTVGSGLVTATSGDASGSAIVRLTPGPPETIVITPPEGKPRVGSDLGLTVIVTDQYGNVIPNPSVTWSVTGPGTLSGTSGTTNTLTASGSGSIAVTATAGGATASATFDASEPEGGGGLSTPIFAGAGVGLLIVGLIVGVVVGRVLGKRRKAPPPPEGPSEP